MQLYSEKRTKAEKNMYSDNGWNLFIFNENYKHTQSKNSISFKQNKKKKSTSIIKLLYTSDKRKIFKEAISKNDTLYSEKQR